MQENKCISNATRKKLSYGWNFLSTVVYALTNPLPYVEGGKNVAAMLSNYFLERPYDDDRVRTEYWYQVVLPIIFALLSTGVIYNNYRSYKRIADKLDANWQSSASSPAEQKTSPSITDDGCISKSAALQTVGEVVSSLFKGSVSSFSLVPTLKQIMPLSWAIGCAAASILPNVNASYMFFSDKSKNSIAADAKSIAGNQKVGVIVDNSVAVDTEKEQDYVAETIERSASSMKMKFKNDEIRTPLLPGNRVIDGQSKSSQKVYNGVKKNGHARGSQSLNVEDHSVNSRTSSRR